MRIERVIIRKLRALRDRNDRLVGLDGATFSAACLRGLNGSGKTTYLDALGELWQWFRRCTKERRYVRPHDGSPLLEADLVAALFTELPGPRKRMWVAWGQPDAIAALPETTDNPYTFHGGRVEWDPQILDFWEKIMERASSGMDPKDWPPNIVSVEAERKYVPELRQDELMEPRPTPAFMPRARYIAGSHGAHLESLLRTLFLARRERWDLLSTWVGKLRPGLSLLDRFDESTQRPLFRLDTGETLTADRLSAGERSLLINLCMVLRWLAPGGIVLIDEPELHLHISLMRSSLAVTESIISEDFHGQLIVASHAPEVWAHFRNSGALLDLGGDGV